jgi:ElaB/YqjD/DUF883 family membrane-anchored ribosome-binding protein
VGKPLAPGRRSSGAAGPALIDQYQETPVGAAYLEAGLDLTEIEMDLRTEGLIKDLKTIVDDAEDLLKATTSQGGDEIARIRARAGESLRAARARMQEVAHSAEAGALEAARDVDRQVHDNAWTAIGIAAATGLVVGILLGRK